MTTTHNYTWLHFDALLTESGWLESAYVALDKHGVLRIGPTCEAPETGAAVSVSGYALPGFINGHSHAFQYAMAGLAEHLPLMAQQDDFWSWREAMYQLALSISPDELEAIATALYAEMLRFGITTVTEFHYVHHDSNGKPYANLAEMSERLIAAAARAGISICLLPVFYQKGGFGKEATPGQRRFLSPSLAEYWRLYEASTKSCAAYEDASHGLAVHSLRAAAPEDVKALLGADLDVPKHIHAAEQVKEIEDCLAAWGQRPVAWLLDHVPLDHTVSLVHATHMTDDETLDLTSRGANVVVCPSTEGNLGDGFFNLQTYLNGGGAFAIGTDSHIALAPWEDLRWLDYGHRLLGQRRNVVCKGGEDSATVLLAKATAGGRQACGRPGKNGFALGEPFDAVILDPNHPVLIGKPRERRLGAFLYAGDVSIIKAVMRRGKTVVKNGIHRDAAGIFTKFKTAMLKLNQRSN